MKTCFIVWYHLIQHLCLNRLLQFIRVYLAPVVKYVKVEF